MSNSKPNFTVLYFAMFQEKAQRSEEIFALEEEISAQQLLTMLCQQYDIELSGIPVRVSINHQFTEMTQLIKPNDIVAFIPPVAGG